MLKYIGILSTFVLIFLSLELYTYFGLKTIFKSPQSIKLFNVVYFIQSLAVLYALYQMYTGLSHGAAFRTTSFNFMIGIVFTVFVTKLVFCTFMLFQDASRVLYYIGAKAKDLISPDTSVVSLPSRRRFFGTFAAGVAMLPFASMLYGISKGKYNYKVSNLKLAFKDLPAAFDGFKIVQISDVHSGSFDSIEDVARGIQMINDLKPDVICFTGDLVNEQKDEINPFIDTFKQLEAPFGKYAVLGNHDYYGVPRNDSSESKSYWEDFYSKFKAMGFNLLNNANTVINKDGESITLAGVENWGASHYFPKKGDLDAAFANVPNDAFKVLMSHDPSHWDAKILPFDKHVHLTMSGHTHGFQFGINIPGFKWSPAQYRYTQWMGLYEEAGEYLYVNRGFGFLGFPGRVGIWPEITVFELKTA